MIKRLLCIGIIYFAVGCYPGLLDYSYDVAGDYHLVRSSAHEVEVVPKDSWSSEDEIIPAKVVEIAWDDKYVIVKQYGMKFAYPDNPNNTYKEPDETQVYYWILDTSDRVRYGPFNKSEFDNQLKQFNLTHLKLKDVKTYR